MLGPSSSPRIRRHRLSFLGAHGLSISREATQKMSATNGKIGAHAASHALTPARNPRSNAAVTMG